MWGPHFSNNHNHSYYPPPNPPPHHYYNNYPCIPPPPPPPWHSCQCNRHAPYYSPTSHFNYNHSEYSNYSRNYPTYDNYNNLYNNYTQPEPATEQQPINNNEVKPRSRKITKNKKNSPMKDTNSYHQHNNTQIYNKSDPTQEETMEEGGEGEHEFVLSEEVLEMFARTEKRRQERKRLQQLEQQQEAQNNNNNYNNNNNNNHFGSNNAPNHTLQEDTPKKQSADITEYKNCNYNSNYANLHVGFRRDPDKREDKSYGQETEEEKKNKRLERSLDTLFDNACEIKAPVLWPAEPLKNW